MKIKKFANRWPLLLVLLLSWWAVKPLFCSGFFPIHDDTQVVRVQQMAQALKDSQFPVRWVADLGYGFGYPIFNFYAPLAYYVGAIFNLVGFDALIATKIMFGLGIILSGIFMYLLAKEFWGKWGGLVAALFYVYAPYHAVNIYVRGAVAEFWAMAMLPLVFLGIYKMFKCSNVQMFSAGGGKWVVVSSLGFAGVILSHNLTAMMMVPFILLSILVLFSFSKTKKYFILYNLYFILLSLGLSAFFWLPALSEMSLTKVLGQIGGGADWRDHFVFLDQLWASPWGFGGSSPGRLDGMSFMIGKIHLLMVFLSLVILFRVWRDKKRILSIPDGSPKGFLRGEVAGTGAILFATGGLLLAVFLTNQISWLIWEVIRPMAFIQYPWRFLIFAILAASFMAGAVVSWRPKKFNRWPVVVGLFVSGLLVLNAKYFLPQTYFSTTTADYINEENIKWKTSKISDEYLPKDFPVPQTKEKVGWDKITVTKGQAAIENLRLKTHQYDFEVVAREPVEILVNTAFFPGWRVWVGGQEVQPKIDSGRIELSFSPGSHQAKLRFTNTPIRSLANLLSLISLAGLGVGMLKYLYGRI